MVETDVLDHHRVRVDPQIVPDPTLRPDGDVAQADRSVTVVEQRLGDDPDRIGEVDEPRARVGAGRRPLGQVEDHRHRSQGLGQSARADGLLAQAAEADRKRLVDPPRRLTADPELDDDEVRPFERGVGVRRRRERAGPPARPQDPLREPADDVAPKLVGIEQDEIVDHHTVLVIAEAVDEFGSVGAAAADHGHLDPHVGQRNIRRNIPACPDAVAAEPVVLAVDGGSTKTDAVLVGLGGALLGRAQAGPSNHQLVGVDGMLDILEEAVRSAAAAAGIDVERQRSDRPARRLLPRRSRPSARRGEARARDRIEGLGRSTSFCATTRSPFRVPVRLSPWGVGVVCGTGVNCAGIGPDGRTVRFPALAELSGDFAPGGAWLGVRALGLALRATDGRGPATSLSELVPAHFGYPDAESVLAAVYGGELAYNRLFELARVLLDASADGDGPARESANTLADEVVAFVRAAIDRLQVADEEVEVVLGGGVFKTRDRHFHDRVARGIRAAAPRSKLVYLRAPPVLGAALIGLDALDATSDAELAIRARLSD